MEWQKPLYHSSPFLNSYHVEKHLYNKCTILILIVNYTFFHEVIKVRQQKKIMVSLESLNNNLHVNLLLKANENHQFFVVLFYNHAFDYLLHYLLILHYVLIYMY